MITLIFTNLVIELTSAVSDIGSNEPTTGKKVKVFILAGQSNMEGHSQVRSLNHLGKHPQYGHFTRETKKHRYHYGR